MHVAELMTHPAITCRVTDDLATIAGLMWNHDCGVLVVVDNGGGHVVGVITDRDVCMAAYTQGRPLDEILVRTAMASPVATCRPRDDVAVAEALMRTRQIRRVVVVDEAGRPAGVLSLNDLARDALTRGEETGAAYDVLRTLAAVCAPRSLARRPAVAADPGPVRERFTA